MLRLFHKRPIFLMLTVISPAKTLDYETPPVTRKHSQPAFLDEASELVQVMQKQSEKGLAKLMGISPKLASLNAERYRDFSLPFDRDNAKQALLAFKGDVYLGLQAEDYKPRDFDFAQKNLRILSGLYGVLRPLDLVQPYRLEMGTKIKNPGGKNLYDFWTAKVSSQLAQELSQHRNKTLINLASNEYFGVVDPTLLPGQIITPVFKDFNKGSYKILSFFAKKARGAMATYIVQNRINKPADIKDFDVDGYRFNDDFSNDNSWVFTRKGSA